jgi:undecaprenyl-diphosphatase
MDTRFSPAAVPVRRRRVPFELLIAVVLLAGFVWLLVEVVRHGGVTQLDQEVAESLHRTAVSSPGLTEFFLKLTDLGSRPFLFGLASGVALLLIVMRLWRLALLWAAAQILAALFVAGVKLLVERPRAVWPDPITTESSFSFPSGHSAGSSLAYGMLAYLIWLRWPSRWPRGGAIAALGALVLLIGFSRMYLGVHYLSDVCAGYCVGLITLCLCIAVVESVRRREPVVDRPGG